MNLVDMTLQNGPSSDMTVSTSRTTTLNPEATVYCPTVPRLQNNTDESSSTYMNGDVSHDPCGKKVPTADADNHASGMMDTENGVKPSEQDAATQEEPSTQVAPTEPQVQEAQTPNASGDSNQEPSEKPEDENAAESALEEPLSRDKIKALLSEQVALFFSRENWSSDPYLISQMDSDQYVPVFILAGCVQFSSITKDQMLVLETLRDSEFVQLDEEKGRVRPNYKRCIVILREIPSSTPSEEIEALFDHKDCPKVISCEFVNNGSWYITFDNDDDAQKAYSYLRETVKIFKGKPILARIKTKPISRQGCFSVLPSKSGGGVPKMPNGPAAGLPGGMQPPAPAMGNLPSMQGSQGAPGYNRLYLPPNSQYYGYQQMPAVFYPNPTMAWNPPNVYDIQTFLNYNGLTPKGTYKPTTKKGNRTKKDERDGGRHMSGGSNASTSNRSGHPAAPDSPHGTCEGGAEGGLDAQFVSTYSQSDMQHLTGDPLYTAFTATGTTLVKADGVPSTMESERLMDPMMLHSATPVMSKPMDSMTTPSTVSHMPIQTGYAQSHMAGGVPSYHVPQRNGYMGRGGGRQKRMPRQDGDSLAASQPNRNGYQRALGPSAAERAAYHDRRKPQFDLQASAFPPLPGADGNQDTAKKSPTAEASDKKFSDIMKGTPKLKSEKSQDKEEPPVPTSAEASKPSVPVSAPTSSHADSQTPSAAPTSVDTSAVPAQSGSQAKAADTPPAKQVKGDKRPYKNGPKESSSNGRSLRRDHKQVSNKENRPTESSSRSWREKKDEDGWITKGPREPRVPVSEPVKDNKIMVNGDQTPHPPKKNEVKDGNDGKKPVKSTTPAAETRTSNCTAPPPQSSPESNRKPSWANMARSGKNEMEKLSAELKEKEEAEKQRKQKVVSKSVPPKSMPVIKEKPSKKEHNTSDKADVKTVPNAWTKRPKTPPK